MKLFIAWSGDLSQKIGLVLHHWIRPVLQNVTPYISSEDIEKGQAWRNEISKNLKEAKFGVIVVTKSNYNKPWLNFEAGALANKFEDLKICPLLFDIEGTELEPVPISQFQYATFSREDMLKLLQSINIECENNIAQEVLLNSFEMYWPKLNEALVQIRSEYKQKDDAKKHEREVPEILREILDISRNQARVMNNIQQRMSIVERAVFMAVQTKHSKNDYLNMYSTKSNLFEWDSLVPGTEVTWDEVETVLKKYLEGKEIRNMNTAKNDDKQE